MQSPANNINGKNKTDVADLSQLPALIELGESPRKIHPGCPCFGTKTDSQTKYLYPTPEGSCHALKKTTIIPLAYQGSFCLTEQFANCPKYNQSEPVPITSRLKPSLTVMILFFVLMAVLSTIGAWLIIEIGGGRLFALNAPDENGSLRLDVGGSAGILNSPPPTNTLSPSPTNSVPPPIAGDRLGVAIKVPRNELIESFSPTPFPIATETSSPPPTMTNTPVSSATPTATPSTTPTAPPKVTVTPTAARSAATAVVNFTLPTRIQSRPFNSNGQSGFPGGNLAIENPAQPAATKISLNR